MSDFIIALRKEATKLKETDKLYDVKQANIEIESMLKDRPYRNSPKFFKKCRISLMALIKMLNHAQMGGNVEVMGHFTGTLSSNI
jgi:COP9 signalosome complex subunit 5